MPATPGWGSELEHYDDAGTLLPDPGLTKPKKLAPQEKLRVLAAAYRRYATEGGSLSQAEWMKRRKGQTIDQRMAENELLGITADPSQYIGE